MLSTLASLTFWQAKNRIRVRLARLKQPRYLVGSIAGIAYIGYFAILRNPGFSRGRGGAAAAANFARAAGPLELGAASLLLLLAALVWILPAAGSAVRFSPSEVQFLFPAPITRRQLLQYRLLRAQLGLLFGRGARFGDFDVHVWHLTPPPAGQTAPPSAPWLSPLPLRDP